MRNGYTKRHQVKIVRTTHSVTFGIGILADDIRLYMVNMPAGARLTDIAESEDGPVTLTFQEESEVQ